MSTVTADTVDPVKLNDILMTTDQESEIEDSSNILNSNDKEENTQIKEMTSSTGIPPLPKSRLSRSRYSFTKPIFSSSTKSNINSYEIKTPISSESSSAEETTTTTVIPGSINISEDSKNFTKPIHPLLLRKMAPSNTEPLESSYSATSQHLTNRSINISHNIFEPQSVRNRTRSSSVDAKITTPKSLDISLPISNTVNTNNHFNFMNRVQSVEMIDYITTNAYKTSVTLPNNYNLPTPRNNNYNTTTDDKNSIRTSRSGDNNGNGGGSDVDLGSEDNYRNTDNVIHVTQQRTSTIIDNTDNINLSKCITNYKSNNKNLKEFNNLKIIQDLEILDGSITCMSFSNDGHYTAFGCQNSVIYVFSILKNNTTSQLFFDSNPTRVYTGHTGTIISISWSNSLFILSSSKDNTMKLWNIKLPNCLHTFRSNILNICLDFQPNEDQYFISGSIDGTLKLWQLPDAITIHWIQLPNMITYCKYTNDGQMCCIGLKNGDVLIYMSQNLKYVTRIEYPEIKKKSKKEDNEDVIGISFFHSLNHYCILISTIDNLIRCYNMKDYELLYQFKNLVKIPNEMSNRNINLTSNQHILQLQQHYNNYISTFNNNMKYVISASNTNTILIVNTKPEIPNGFNCFRICSPHKNFSYESFDINDSISQAMFIPDISLQYWNSNYIPYSGVDEENEIESDKNKQKLCNTIIAITNNGHVKVIKANYK